MAMADRAMSKPSRNGRTRLPSVWFHVTGMGSVDRWSCRARASNSTSNAKPVVCKTVNNELAALAVNHLSPHCVSRSEVRPNLRKKKLKTRPDATRCAGWLWRISLPEWARVA